MFLEIYPCRMSDLLIYNCLQYFLIVWLFFFFFFFFSFFFFFFFFFVLFFFFLVSLLSCVCVCFISVSLLSFSKFIYLKSLFIDEPGWRLINFVCVFKKTIFCFIDLFIVFLDSLFPLWVLLLHSFCWFGFWLFFFFLIR